MTAIQAVTTSRSTGGYATLVLSWGTIRCFAILLTRISGHSVPLSAESTLRVLNHMSSSSDPHVVPTSLRTAVAIRNACLRSDTNEHEIENLVSAEPAVAAAMLRFANSALYSPSRPINSVWEAALLLGHETIRHIASHVAMIQVVHGLRSQVLRTAGEQLHHHCLAVSALAAELARSVDDGLAEPAAANALFHELPLFLWLASLERGALEGTVSMTPAALQEQASSASLLPLDLALRDLGLEPFVGRRLIVHAVFNVAHRQSWVPNPLLVEPAPPAPEEEQALSLSDAQIAAAQAHVRELLSLIGQHSGLPAPETPAAPKAAPASAAASSPGREVDSEAQGTRPSRHRLWVVLALAAAGALAWWFG